MNYDGNARAIWWTITAFMKTQIQLEWTKPVMNRPKGDKNSHKITSEGVNRNSTNNHIFDETTFIFTGGNKCGREKYRHQSPHGTGACGKCKFALKFWNEFENANMPNMPKFSCFCFHLGNDTKTRQKQMWRGCQFFFCASCWCVSTHQQKCFTWNSLLIWYCMYFDQFLVSNCY